MKKLFERSTGEILIVLVGVTVCGYVVVNTIILLLVVFFTDRDVSSAAGNIGDIINTLIGLLAGFLAGRTDASMSKVGEKEKEDEAEQ